MTRLICLGSEGTSTQLIAVISGGFPACTPTPRTSTASPTSSCEREVLGLSHSLRFLLLFQGMLGSSHTSLISSITYHLWKHPSLKHFLFERLAASTSDTEKKINYAWVVLCTTANRPALDKWCKPKMQTGWWRGGRPSGWSIQSPAPGSGFGEPVSAWN